MSSIGYYDNGNIEHIYYYDEDGELHNYDKPAKIEYNISGTILREVYYIHGLLHNHKNAAIFEYHNNGALKNKIYYHYGKFIKIENFLF